MRKPIALFTRFLLASLLAFVVVMEIKPSTYADDPQVQEIEIEEYEGERLGSVDDFRQNAIRGTQTIDIDAYRLRIDGLTEQSSSYTYDELIQLPHQQKLVSLYCVEGWSVKALWEGIPLAGLLESVGPLPGANTVVFHADDGYTTSLPLQTVLDRNLILADRINGIVLPPAQGFPFMLVAEEKWGYKWIRWVVRIELVDDPEYRGFWESRGYSNDAELSESFIGP